MMEVNCLVSDDARVMKTSRGKTYTCDGRVWDLCADGHDEQDPRLWVVEGLPHLIFLEYAVLDTLSVQRDTIHGYDTLAFGEELGG